MSVEKYEFETLSGLDPREISEGDMIRCTYDSKRSPTPVSVEGEIVEISDNALETMIVIEPFKSHKRLRYLALFEDDSNLHTPHKRNGAQTLNTPDSRVTAVVETETE